MSHTRLAVLILLQASMVSGGQAGGSRPSERIEVDKPKEGELFEICVHHPKACAPVVDQTNAPLATIGGNPVHPAQRPNDPTFRVSPEEARSFHDAATGLARGSALEATSVGDKLVFSPSARKPNATLFDLSHPDKGVKAVPVRLSREVWDTITQRSNLELVGPK